MGATASGPKRRLREPQRRRVILDAARQVFAEHGPEATSMAQIADLAGVTRSVVYDHFASKEELLLALLRAHHEQWMAALERLSAVDVLDEATLRAMVAGYLEQADADPAGWRILCLERSSDPEVAAYQRQTAQEVEERIAQLLGRTRPLGERRIIARAMRAAVNELVAARYDRTRLSRKQVVDLVMDLCWHGLARSAGAP